MARQSSPSTGSSTTLNPGVQPEQFDLVLVERLDSDTKQTSEEKERRIHRRKKRLLMKHICTSASDSTPLVETYESVTR